MKKIRTYQDFQRNFPTEEACFQYLIKEKWPNGFQCPKCGNTKAYHIKKRKIFALPPEISIEDLPDRNAPVPYEIQRAFIENKRQLSNDAEFIFDLNADFIWRIQDGKNEYIIDYNRNELKVYKRVHIFQCISNVCRRQTSVTAGTIMHKTHLPLLTWFYAIFLMSVNKKGISSKQLQGMINVSSKTAWYLTHRIRQAMTHKFSNLPLKGIIQTDEAYFGGKGKGKRGRGAEKKQPVVIGVEERSKMINDEPTVIVGRALMMVVDNVSANELVDGFIETHVQPGSMVKSDGWVGYSPLDPTKFKHHVKTASEDPDRTHLKLAHQIIGNVKNWLRGIFHGAVGKHLQRYLTEFTYRLNRRNRVETIFGRLVRNLLLGEPVLYRRLINCEV